MILNPIILETPLKVAGVISSKKTVFNIHFKIMNNVTVQMQSILELVPSTIDNLLQSVGQKVKLSEEEIYQIRLILEEAIANGISHGNNYDTSLKVHISISVENGVIKMSVKDEGKGFNLQEVPDPVKNESTLKPGGRGIYIIKDLADDVKFNDQGNEIIITKKTGKSV